jgi:hypothetical protein
VPLVCPERIDVALADLLGSILPDGLNVFDGQRLHAGLNCGPDHSLEERDRIDAVAGRDIPEVLDRVAFDDT